MATPIASGTRLGDYRVLGFVGAGGMGTVYRAEHARHGYAAALKVITSSDPRAAARFRNEAHLLAQIRHPHVARFYDFFEHGGRACLAMEFVEGPTIRDVLVQHGGRMPEAEALRTFRDVADALAHLHARGILHRDLKSGNLKLTRDGRVKVLDFGIARLDGTTRLTAAGQVVGTPHCLAPEQVRGEPPTPQTDLWALGVMLYEWVTGEPPFAGEGPTLNRRILAADYEPPSALALALSEPTCAIIDRCLRARPSARPASAEALVRTVEAVLATPPDGRTPARPGRIRRRTARLGAAAAGAVLAVAVALWMAWVPCAFPGECAPPRPPPAPTSAVIPTPMSGPADALESGVEVVIDVFGAPADVYREGRAVGRTPYRLRAPAGERVRLELHRPGYRPRKLQMQIPATATTFTETLEPLR